MLYFCLAFNVGYFRIKMIFECALYFLKQEFEIHRKNTHFFIFETLCQIFCSWIMELFFINRSNYFNNSFKTALSLLIYFALNYLWGRLGYSGFCEVTVRAPGVCLDLCAVSIYSAGNKFSGACLYVPLSLLCQKKKNLLFWKESEMYGSNPNDERQISY